MCVQGSSHGVDLYEPKPVVFCEIHSNEVFPTVLKISDAAFGNEMHPIAPLIPFEMMNTSGATHYNKPNSLMQHCGWEGARAAKSASLPQSIRSVKSISLCMFAPVCNNYNLHPKQA